ncbi:hypothetical protein [Rummeliibacillus suwonensis]|uniref:hypothetical protein n=1 Tax=Rummeliibacillus suwonensis TaxID=1306154 RepID=UPI002898CA5E|nr:hypothetical protein [Rummeliibacillus suwonensis]
MNNKVVSLKNVLAGKDVSLNYIYWRYNSLDVTNYSILKYKEDHSGNLPYIKLHLGKKTNGVKYLSGYKTVKVTVNVTKTGAYNLSRLKNNEREIYFNVGYYSDYNQSITENYDTNWSYELSATEKKTLLTYTFPKNYTYDDGLLILFPEVEGITFENLVFNK